MFYRFIRSFAKTFFRIFYRLRVTGTEKLPKGAAILAPNHASHFDPPLVGVSSPEEVHFLARETLFRPPLSYLITRLNAHAVSRGEADIASMRLILRLLSEGKKVVIFPEGTRTLDGNLQEAKQGVAMLAMKANCPIVPIYIEGTYEVWKKGQKRPHLKGQISCHYGDPIYPHKVEGLPRKEEQKMLAKKWLTTLSTLASMNSPPYN